MMGRTHATSGAVAYLAALPVLTHYGVDVDPIAVVAGTVAAAGAAMLPDFDHQHATIAQALGPFTKALAQIIGAVSGGHRNGTHSLLGLGAFVYLSYWIGEAGGIALGLWLAFLFAVATAALRLEMTRATSLHYLISGVGGVALVSTSAFAHFPVDVIPWAVGIGVAAHIAGDMLTKEGCPLLWPISRQRFKVLMLTTEGFTERTIIGPGLGLLAVVLTLYQAGLVDTLRPPGA
ncbi:metal-dependent hydrolase [Nocardioides pakistanensis]